MNVLFFKMMSDKASDIIQETLVINFAHWSWLVHMAKLTLIVD